MNSKYKPFTYKSTMWADASGYYMYLPATLIYNWQYDQIQPGIDTLTGRGFELVQASKTVYTKYTNGIAYLQLPFFTIVHLYTLLSGGKADGFSPNYINVLLFSGVFYLILGLFFLYGFLSTYFSKNASAITCFAILACSNLYFYGIEHNGLTHVYSFSIISFILYRIKDFKSIHFLQIIPLMGLLVLIRPTNILFALPLLVYFLLIQNKNKIKLQWGHILLGSMMAIVTFIPQLAYWKYVSGSSILYSYENEGFIFWKAPKILSVLFAPNNGFFVYAPILFLALWGLIKRPIDKRLSATILITFCLLTYINASWWSWYFGCAYGARAFIEIYPFFCIGLAQIIQMVEQKNKVWKTSGILALLLFAAFNLRLLYGYDDCWYSSDWDYAYLLEILNS